MAGPKAPIGTMAQHSQKSASLVQSASHKKFGAPSNAAAKRVNLPEESESDSSDSDSDASGSSDVDHDQILRELNSKALGTKPKATVNSPAPASKKIVAKIDTPVAGGEAKKAAESSSEESSSESESEEESSSESEDEDKAIEASKGAKLNGELEAGPDENNSKAVTKSKSESASDSETSSSSSSESESEEDPVEEETAKSQAKGKAVSSPSDSEESESSASESDEEADESMAIDQRNGNTALSRVPEVVSNEFHLRKADEGTNAADVAQFFNQAKMEGKQIWYFTAPASIPIEVVEKLEIPLERAQKGQSILSHNGDDYGVAFEDAATSRAIKLLIPSKAGDQYHLLNAPVAQTMHLKRVTQFSQDGQSTLSLTQTAQTSTGRPPRPQPAGLRARFQPIGVSNGSVGNLGLDEDVDMVEAPALPSSQKTPSKKSKKKDIDRAADPKKRKLDSVTGATPTRPTNTPESSKKVKKARVESEPTPKAKSQAPGPAVSKITPIAPPVIPSIRGVSSSQPPPSSTPSHPKASKAKVLPSSQPTPAAKPAAEPTSSRAKKETQVPLPPSFQRASASFSSQHASPAKEEPQAKEEAKTNGKAKKEKKTKIAKTESGLEAPKKTTPVPLPNMAMP